MPPFGEYVRRQFAGFQPPSFGTTTPDQHRDPSPGLQLYLFNLLWQMQHGVGPGQSQGLTAPFPGMVANSPINWALGSTPLPDQALLENTALPSQFGAPTPPLPPVNQRPVYGQPSAIGELFGGGTFVPNPPNHRRGK